MNTAKPQAKFFQSPKWQRYAESERVHVLAYVDDMSLLLDSADLYLSKPGGISVSEAAVKELPMVLIDAVAGCEEYNRSFFTLHGAAVTADSVEGLAAQCLHLLSDEVELARMRQSMRALACGNAAELIYNSLRYPLQQSVLLQKKVGSR